MAAITDGLTASDGLLDHGLSSSDQRPRQNSLYKDGARSPYMAHRRSCISFTKQPSLDRY